MADRRATPDRRTSRHDRRSMRDRKKTSENRIAVIELAESELRVAVLERTAGDDADRVTTLTLPWRHEATSPNSDIGRQELTAALKQLVEIHGLAGCQARFVLGGQYCVTKAIVGSTDEVRAKLQQLQQRSQLYLLLGTGEKVLVSSSKALDARHSYAVASVCNAKTLDTLYEVGERTGLRIESIEPALVANSRAIGRLSGAPTGPTLLVHMDDAAAEIGVAHNGRLLLEYRPGSCATPQELVEVLRTHLGRLERHISRVLGESSPKLQDIYLSGDRQTVMALARAFIKVPNIQCHVVVPTEIQATWKLATDANDPATVPVLGTMLGTYLPAGESDAPNFMDHITAISREPLRPVVIRSLLPVAAVLLVALGLKAFNIHQQGAINDLQSQIDELAVAETRARELRLRRTASEAKLAQLEQIARQLVPRPTADVLRRIAHCMPSDVWLNSLALSNENTLALQGSSFLEAGVFDFVRWLELAPGFEHVALRGTKSSHSQAGPTVDFDVQLILGDPRVSPAEIARHE